MDAHSNLSLKPPLHAGVSAERVTMDALTERDCAAWTALRQSNPDLYSPYFHLDYSRHVAALRDDISVIIARDKCGDAVGFLPLQGVRFARPVGAPMTDYHGFICAPDTHLDIAALLKSCGIGAFYFDHLITDMSLPTAGEPKQSAAIRVSSGGQVWREGKDRSYRRHAKDCNRRMRRAEEDVGPVTVEFKSNNREAFEEMIRWKTDQYEQTGLYNVLGAQWTRALLDRLWAQGGDADLRLDMHTVSIDGALAAVDCGLTDGHTFHSWMVAYDPKFNKYSPGTQLLEALIDEAQSLGYDIIDLGAGLDGYKRYYTDVAVFSRAGFIAARGPAAALAKVYGAAEHFAERDSHKGILAKAGKIPGRFRRRYQQVAACDPSFTGRTKAMLSAIKNSGK